MSDKENDDILSDDSEYDDALDESFEFDDDYDDVDLDYEADNLDGDDGEWDDEGQVEQEVADSFQPKKSKISFNAIVITGAVIVGLFIVYAQMQPEPPEYGKVEKTKFTTALKMDGAFKGPGAIKEEVDPEEDDADSQSDAEKEQGFLFDTEVADTSQEVVVDTPPMPSPISSEVDEAGDEIDQASSPVEKTEVVETTQALSSSVAETELETRQAMNEDDLFGLTDDDSNKQETIAETEVGETAEKPKTDIVDDEIVQNEAVKQEMSLGSLSSTVSNDEKLDSIIKRLDGLESKLNEFQTANIEKMKIITADIDSMKQSTSKKAVAEKASVKKPRQDQTAKVEKETKSKSKAVVTPPKKKKKASSKIVWTLRAAQPGKAWVSKKGHKEMQPIVVGDKLSGIGRIQNILYRDGKWTVQGTSGRIMQ